MLEAQEPQLGEQQVASAVEELVSRGIVRPLVASGEISQVFVFAHTLAQDVAYTGIPKVERARKHAQLALWSTTSMSASVGVGEVDAFVATQAEQAVALATEMRLAATDTAWTARSVGVTALVRLGQAALAQVPQLSALRGTHKYACIGRRGLVHDH